MLLMNSYDARPEAMVVPHLRCVICGGSDAPMNVAWFSDIEPVRRQTIPLAVHKGACDRRLEQAAGDSGMWEEAEDFAQYVQSNTQDPPQVGVERDGEELLRLAHYPVDLAWTQEILVRANSPLIAAAG